MRTAVDPAARVEELLRRLRPPELRDVPDEFYEAVVRQARRIYAADRRIRSLRKSIEEARYAIERGTFPMIYGYNIFGNRTSEAYFHDHDEVTCCWMIECCADPSGLARLAALYAYARSYSTGWNHIYAAGVVGALRSNSCSGLVYRAAPATWALTDLGRELIDLVFGPPED